MDDEHCSEARRRQGLPYLRTCAVCGLGKCRIYPPEASQPAQARPLKIGELRRGDIVRNASGESYVVDKPMGLCAIAVRSIAISNPDEWVLIDPQTGEPKG